MRWVSAEMRGLGATAAGATGMGGTEEEGMEAVGMMAAAAAAAGTGVEAGTPATPATADEFEVSGVPCVGTAGDAAVAEMCLLRPVAMYGVTLCPFHAASAI